MLSEFLKPEEKLEVLQSRYTTQSEQIEEAKTKIAETEGDEKTLWENRLNQYEEELYKIRKEMEGLQEEEKAA